MEAELKRIRRTFIQYLLVNALAWPAVFIVAVLLGSATHIAIGFVFGLLGIIGSIVYEGYLYEKVIFSRCPNCGKQFYSFWRWPFIGFVYYFFFNNCSHCQLNGFGKNIDEYQGH